MLEIIRPSSELRNKYSEVVKECRDKNVATILTVNGKGDSVILDLEKYREIMDELELMRNLAEAEEDVREGRVAPVSDMFISIRKKIETMEF
ncbi:MAG: type II toxin-antitoxin system Phd/YefM family antitoxin [Erysipelotrichaceae bacterium]|nr:type II toxin-antitoxin system Phd/YefM family antitoxin [Erysipelotrichaceae bacterium]